RGTLEAALGGTCDDIPLIDVDLGAQSAQAKQEKVDGAGPDGAAAWQRHAGFVAAGEQRPDHPEAGPHLGHEIIGRGGVDDIGGMEGHALADTFGLAAATAVNGNVDAVILEDALELLDVGEPRHVFEHQRLIGEQRSDHQWQGGILGARDGDFAPKLVAANQTNSIHVVLVLNGDPLRVSYLKGGRPSLLCPVDQTRRAQRMYDANSSPEIGLRFLDRALFGGRRSLGRQCIAIGPRPSLSLATLEVLAKLCGQSLLTQDGLFGLAHAVPDSGVRHRVAHRRFLALRRAVGYGSRAPVPPDGPAPAENAAVAQW